MIGTETLSRFEEAGYVLTLEAGELRAFGPTAPPENLLALVEENRDGLKAAILLENPPEWLAWLFDLYWSGRETHVRLTGNSGKAETYLVSVSIKNICTAVAAEIGMPVLEWERIREEVEEVLGSWEGAA